MKPQLKPLQVPWEIVTDTSYFKLDVSEVNNVQLSFVATILLNGYFEERKIQVIFHNTFKTQTSVKWSDRNTINPSDYDWRDIKEEFLPHLLIKDVDDFEANQKKFRHIWMTSQVCPVSNAYEVINSTWLIRDDIHTQQHYLFVGVDLYVEVLCAKFEWQSLGQIDWS